MLQPISEHSSREFPGRHPSPSSDWDLCTMPVLNRKLRIQAFTLPDCTCSLLEYRASTRFIRYFRLGYENFVPVMESKHLVGTKVGIRSRIEVENRNK